MAWNTPYCLAAPFIATISNSYVVRNISPPPGLRFLTLEKMLGAVNLQLSSTSAINSDCSYTATTTGLCRRSRYDLRLPFRRRFASLTVQSHHNSSKPAVAQAEDSSETPISSQFIMSVGSPSSQSVLQLSHWNLTQRHIVLLNVIACSVAVSATWLFVSAIPALLAFKRAAESLEKLMDVTREELPDTMAAVRLSGMEISDLTMELSDIGQGITEGVRNSTRAVRLAEERLRQVTNMASSVSLQRVGSPKTKTGEPSVARTAREIREGIIKGRALLQMFFTLTRFSKIALNYFGRRAKP